ncbi:MAG: hypothetical protein JW727_03965 [Candidatus Aenigmarchaeota archaeon]|nr:hypothetical protein [Candidatus Aenigmarchaeota archaeon]
MVNISSLPMWVIILASAVLLMVIFTKVLNIDVLGNISSMIMGLARNILASVSF